MPSTQRHDLSTGIRRRSTQVFVPVWEPSSLGKLRPLLSGFAKRLRNGGLLKETCGVALPGDFHFPCFIPLKKTTSLSSQLCMRAANLAIGEAGSNEPNTPANFRPVRPFRNQVMGGRCRRVLALGKQGHQQCLAHELHLHQRSQRRLDGWAPPIKVRTCARKGVAPASGCG